MWMTSGNATTACQILVQCVLLYHSLVLPVRLYRSQFDNSTRVAQVGDLGEEVVHLRWRASKAICIDNGLFLSPFW